MNDEEREKLVLESLADNFAWALWRRAARRDTIALSPDHKSILSRDNSVEVFANELDNALEGGDAYYYALEYCNAQPVGILWREIQGYPRTDNPVWEGLIKLGYTPDYFIEKGITAIYVRCEY